MVTPGLSWGLPAGLFLYQFASVCRMQHIMPMTAYGVRQTYSLFGWQHFYSLPPYQ